MDVEDDERTSLPADRGQRLLAARLGARLVPGPCEQAADVLAKRGVVVDDEYRTGACRTSPHGRLPPGAEQTRVSASRDN